MKRKTIKSLEAEIKELKKKHKEESKKYIEALLGSEKENAHRALEFRNLKEVNAVLAQDLHISKDRHGMQRNQINLMSAQIENAQVVIRTGMAILHPRVDPDLSRLEDVLERGPEVNLLRHVMEELA